MGREMCSVLTVHQEPMNRLCYSPLAEMECNMKNGFWQSIDVNKPARGKARSCESFSNLIDHPQPPLSPSLKVR